MDALSRRLLARGLSSVVRSRCLSRTSTGSIRGAELGVPQPGINRAAQIAGSTVVRGETAERDISGEFQFVSFNTYGNGALQAIDRDHKALAAAIYQDAFYAVQTSAPDADALSRSQKRLQRTWTLVP